MCLSYDSEEYEGSGGYMWPRAEMKSKMSVFLTQQINFIFKLVFFRLADADSRGISDMTSDSSLWGYNLFEVF